MFLPGFLLQGIARLPQTAFRRLVYYRTLRRLHLEVLLCLRQSPIVLRTSSPSPRRNRNTPVCFIGGGGGNRTRVRNVSSQSVLQQFCWCPSSYVH